MCLAVISCSESDGIGVTENPAMADGGPGDRDDESTDPAVSLQDVGNGMSAMNDAGAGQGEPGLTDAGGTPVDPNDPLVPDAGIVATDPGDEDEPIDEDDEPITEPAGAGGGGGMAGAGGNAGAGGGAGGNAGAGGNGGNAGASGTGGLVGTVCDLLGGLLCPVGLLCVDGLCQESSD
jgi:hypothetical protein